MTQSQCGYCYHPDCDECFPPMLHKQWPYVIRKIPENEVSDLRDAIISSGGRDAVINGLLTVINELKAEIDRLKEIEWMYKDLCK